MPFALKARVVYLYKCLNDSDTSYIGKTKRHMVTRAKEHFATKESNKSEILKHICHCNDCKRSDLTIKNFVILKQCKDDYSARISEALLIKQFQPKINKQKLKRGDSYLLRVF